MKDIKVVPVLLGILSFLMTCLIGLIVYIWIEHNKLQTAREEVHNNILEQLTNSVNLLDKEAVRQKTYDLVQDNRIDGVEHDVDELKLDVRHLKRSL